MVKVWFTEASPLEAWKVSRPMKLQEKLRGLGYASMSTSSVRLSPDRTWIVSLVVGSKWMNPLSAGVEIRH
ncbi:hypothetical protein EYF80_052283 [Liparis tanakae]|uniref:Uncharacterized protein n=1 Tax=Liparis tanakae TaxID=230148 RepID=A0A4Z2F9P9_9TELE|nr:hypothetical protein EYF80_052283 [Liparis tanakae]